MRVPGRLKEEVSGHLGEWMVGAYLARRSVLLLATHYLRSFVKIKVDSKLPVIFYFTHVSFSRNERGIFVVEEMKEASLLLLLLFLIGLYLLHNMWSWSKAFPHTYAMCFDQVLLQYPHLLSSSFF